MSLKRSRKISANIDKNYPNKKVKNSFFDQACQEIKTQIQKHNETCKEWNRRTSFCRNQRYLSQYSFGLQNYPPVIMQHLKDCVEQNPKHAFAYFLMGVIEQKRDHFLQFVKFVDQMKMPYDLQIWPSNVNFCKAYAYQSLCSRLANTNHSETRKHFESYLVCHTCADAKDSYIKFLKSKFPQDDMTKIVIKFKPNFTLSGNNIRVLCHRFGLLTFGFQKYVKKQYVDSYFAMKEFVENEKQWLVCFVAPFSEPDFPIAATEEILAFTYPNF